MKTPIALLILAVFSLSALAADVTGTRKAEFDTQRGLQKYTFALKQDGTSVTGKATVERDGEKREAELKQGKVEGDTIPKPSAISAKRSFIRRRAIPPALDIPSFTCCTASAAMRRSGGAVPSPKSFSTIFLN